MQPEAESAEQLRNLTIQLQELSQREEQLAAKYEATAGELNRHIDNEAHLERTIKELSNAVQALEADNTTLLEEKRLNEPKLLQLESSIQQISMLSHEKKQIEAQLQALSSEHIDGGQMKAQIDHLLEQLSEIPILRE